jgi:hypothetical protein
MARRITIVESALSRFSEKCGADPSIKQKIRDELAKLKLLPELGYPIPFTDPLFYQLPVDDYRIHYQILPTEIKVLYIGILGRC